MVYHKLNEFTTEPEILPCTVKQTKVTKKKLLKMLGKIGSLALGPLAISLNGIGVKMFNIFFFFF